MLHNNRHIFRSGQNDLTPAISSPGRLSLFRSARYAQLPSVGHKKRTPDNYYIGQLRASGVTGNSNVAVDGNSGVRIPGKGVGFFVFFFLCEKRDNVSTQSTSKLGELWEC